MVRRRRTTKENEGKCAPEKMRVPKARAGGKQFWHPVVPVLSISDILHTPDPFPHPLPVHPFPFLQYQSTVEGEVWRGTDKFYIAFYKEPRGGRVGRSMLFYGISMANLPLLRRPPLHFWPAFGSLCPQKKVGTGKM